MGGDSHCYVPGCKSGYPSDRKRRQLEGKRNCSLFAPPREDHLFDLWRKRIPRADKELSKSSKVCDLHFVDDDLERTFTVQLADGKTWTKERSRPVLKKGAVPSIFPNLPEYLTRPSKRRKLPSQRIIDSPDSLLTSESILKIPENQNSAEDLFAKLKNNVVKLDDCWSSHVVKSLIIFAKWNEKGEAERRLVINHHLTVKAFLFTQEVEMDLDVLKSDEDVSSLISKLDDFVICASIEERPKMNCLGWIKDSQSRQKRCTSCIQDQQRNALARYRQKRVNVKNIKYKFLTKKYLNLNRKKIRLTQKVSKLERKVLDIKTKCAASNVEAVEKAIAHLPVNQQQTIRACFEAAKAKSCYGKRYTINFIYECLLVRIKSPKVYEHLRSHDIMALPTTRTLKNYIKKMKGMYGFQENMFHLIAEKTKEMDPNERRGSLLIDEMKVSPRLHFDPQTLEIQGFTQLGDYTPEHQKAEKGDHALVVMFQPFRGDWIQAVGCFLSKGSASGHVLHHLVMEAIILLENSGLLVGAVTTDGATWNRSMWSKFGISTTSVSSVHPVDSTRRLWFFSDFPHLVKNMRNCFSEKGVMMTPDGVVKITFWDAVIAMDNARTYGLKACPKLTPSHVRPKFYQKMNVRKAFQFFSDSVATAMIFYRSKTESLKDCEGTVAFIKRMNLVIDVLNSRLPATALKKGSNDQKVILDFLAYLEDWRNCAAGNKSPFLSESTFNGLLVTLKGTLEILDFLTQECNYDYVMTARLNQDSLERFFGMMRGACGSCDHPDSTMFITLFRLISTYSLIKPPRGSNISGGEILKSLMKLEDVDHASLLLKDRQALFNEKLEALLQIGVDDQIPLSNDHDYVEILPSDAVVYYVSGFIAWRCSRSTQCLDCRLSLVSTEEEGECSEAEFLLLKERTNLQRPSPLLFQLVELIEISTLKVLDLGPPKMDTLFNIMDHLKRSGIPQIGCSNHLLTFTKYIVRFTIITRLHFICKRANTIYNLKCDKARELRKLSKLK